MRQRVRSLVALITLSAGAAVTLPAQIGVHVTAGPTIPVGDYKKEVEAKVGWMAELGVSYPIPSKPNVSVTGEALFGGNSNNFDSDKSVIMGALAGMTLRLGELERPGLFLLGNAGMMKHTFKSDGLGDVSESGFAVGGGVGFVVPRGKTSLFTSIRYLTASTGSSTTSFIPIQAGIRFNFGQKE